MFSQMNLYLFLCLAVSLSFIFYLLKIVISKQIFNRGKKGTFLFFFFFFLLSSCFFKKEYLIFGCTVSLLLCEGILQLQRAGAPLCYSVWASHCRAQALGYGLSNCSTWA